MPIDKRTQLLALADRVEAYTPAGHYELDRERQRELNEGIGLLVGVGHRVKVGDAALGNDRWVPSPLKPYTTSLDAAMTLVPEGWFTSDFHQGPSGGNWWKLSTIRDGQTYYTSFGAKGLTPAAALTAASLRAIAAQEPEQ